jgi:hypothetical protein
MVVTEMLVARRHGLHPVELVMSGQQCDTDR